VWSETKDSERFLLDGRNRLAAAEAVGLLGAIKEAEHIYGGDPFEFAISTNIHRRHLSPRDRNNLIVAILKARPEKSNRQIAEQVKASPTTVGTVRAKLEATGDVSKLDTRADARGRQQPATKPPRPRLVVPDPFVVDTPVGSVPPEVSADERKAQYAAVDEPETAETQTFRLSEASVTREPVETKTFRLTIVNPITAAWEAANETQRREFVRAFSGPLQVAIDMMAPAAKKGSTS
jgi:hypothetical protein